MKYLLVILTLVLVGCYGSPHEIKQQSCIEGIMYFDSTRTPVYDSETKEVKNLSEMREIIRYG